MNAAPPIEVVALSMAYGDRVIQRDLNFAVGPGDIFVIMGGSGCGKSTLLRHLIGLQAPRSGQVRYGGEDYFAATPARRRDIQRGWGVTFQTGALFSAMTLGDNVALPLQLYAGFGERELRRIARYKLALVGLAGFEDYYPHEISGGMRKRAALARAIALDPSILFFDEPSAGLDPLSSRRLDELILELNRSTGATVVMVTHELPSIFGIASNGVFLDAGTRTQLDVGNPRVLRTDSAHAHVREFLGRGDDPAQSTVRTP